jgi:hypothetical protein
VLTVLVTGIAVIPLVAIRLGRLPMPIPIQTPDGDARSDPATGAGPDRATVFAAVVRTDELITGMLLGYAVVALCAMAVLAGPGGGVAGQVLAAVAGAGFLLRARLFPTVRQRLPLLVAGAGSVLVLVLSRPAMAAELGLAAGLAGFALLAMAAGAVYRRRAPGPYLGRAADILDALAVVSVIPIACAVLGLYGRMRGLIS